MLIVVAGLFAVLWLPYRGWMVYNSFVEEENKLHDDWYSLASKTMVFVNSAMNPVLYSVICKKFRQAFVNHTCIGRLVSSDPQGLRRTTTSTITNNNNGKCAVSKSQYSAILGKSADSLSPPAEEV